MDDSDARSRNARIRIDVTQNQRPSPTSSLVTGNEDEVLTIVPGGRDPDNDQLQALITVLPFRGRLYQCVSSGSTCTPGEEMVLLGEFVPVTDSQNRAVYIPQADEFGSPFDSIEFKVADELGLVSNTAARVTITILPLPDNPVARNVSLIPQPEDQPVGILLAGFDPDPGEDDSLTGWISILPRNGRLFQSDGVTEITQGGTRVTDKNRKVTYLPDPNWNSGLQLDNPDFFSFFLTDVTNRQSNEAWVRILIKEVNDDPIAYGQNISVGHSTLTTITLESFDVDQTCALCTGAVISRYLSILPF